MNMPRVDLEPVKSRLESMSYKFTNPLTDEDQIVDGFTAASRIIATQGKNSGCLRASKPAMHEYVISRERHGYTSRYRDYALWDCASAQIWRFVAFEVSPMGQHHCLPIMADFDCPFDMPMDEMRIFSRWCQSVADVVLETIPRKPGLERWAHALYGG